MSEILSQWQIRGHLAWYLVLDCGHWYKWTGPNKPPKTGRDITCPSCKLPQVINHPDVIKEG